MAKSKPKKNAGAVVARKREMVQEKAVLSAIQADRYHAFQYGENIGYTNAVIIFFWLLHTEHGYGEKRLKNLLAQHLDFCNEYIMPTAGHKKGEFQGVTLDDMCQALKDECDIDIDWRKGIANIEQLDIKLMVEAQVNGYERAEQAKETAG